MFGDVGAYTPPRGSGYWMTTRERHHLKTKSTRNRMSTNVFIYWRKSATKKPQINKECNPIFMHTLLYGAKNSVFGNDGVFDLGTKIFLQQVEHGRVLLLYTLMPLLRSDPLSLCLSLSHLVASHCTAVTYKTQNENIRVHHSTAGALVTFRSFHCRISCLWCGIRIHPSVHRKSECH
jgi:hypothetical protein